MAVGADTGNIFRMVAGEGLAEARQRALANRRVARSGGDPRPAARRTPGVPTFDEAAATVLAIHGTAWKSGGRNANSWQGTLRDYASPHLGRKAVDRVTTADVMAVLLPIWTRKHATAQKVRQCIGTVMKWAIAQGYRSDNPAADALTAALPKRSVPVRHQRALPHGEVSSAVAAVRASASWAGLKLVFDRRQPRGRQELSRGVHPGLLRVRRGPEARLSGPVRRQPARERRPGDRPRPARGGRHRPRRSGPHRRAEAEPGYFG